jgi:exonuclease III
MALQPSLTTICYWNCRGLINKKHTLEDFLYEQKIDICGISETKFTPQTKQTFKRYNLFHHSQADGTEGLAILANRTINYKILNIQFPNNFPRVMVIQFFITNKSDITMVLIYSHPQKFLSKAMLQDILTQIQNSNSNIKHIIGRDFNSHHPLWGSESESRKGKEVAQLITKHDLVLLNDGSVTRIGTHIQRNTMIDLTLVSPNLGISCDWHTHPDTLGSDHLPIITTIRWQNGHGSPNNLSS